MKKEYICIIKEKWLGEYVLHKMLMGGYEDVVWWCTVTHVKPRVLVGGNTTKKGGGGWLCWLLPAE